jgi:hypothetical protein
MAAQEITDQDLKRIFERLAELYEANASKLEAVAQGAELFHPEASTRVA